MLDIKLTYNDFSIDARRSLAVVSDSKLVLQKIYIGIKLQQGLYYYDENAGIDWTSFIANSLDSNIIIIYLMKYLYEIRGVAKIYSLRINFDEKRNAVISGMLEDDFGEIVKMESMKDV
jgi:hypothetical protein